MKPSLYLSEKELPDMAKMDVGNEVKFLVEAKLTSKSIQEMDGKKSMNCSFEISQIKVVDGSASSKNFKDFEKEFNSKK